MAQSEPSDATHVVTCFILRRVGEQDEILLARRSQNVRTYQGAWAGVSGYIEPDTQPLEQAYTEVREETGLTQVDVRLLRTGESLPFHDDALGQAWVVHPFLFALLAPDHIQTDWEAVEIRWVTPEMLGSLNTVPRLSDALARVYPYEVNAAGYTDGA